MIYAEGEYVAGVNRLMEFHPSPFFYKDISRQLSIFKQSLERNMHRLHSTKR